MTPRLTKDARRSQLLDVAHRIVRDEGTDALTLARLAEQAGVSKPLAYDHFATRAGLLAALYRFYEEQQNVQLRTALADCGSSLRSTIEIVAAAYVDCTVSAGPEYEEISAALLAYEETKDYLQVSRDAYIEEYRAAFGPFAELDGARGRAVLSGLVGSAEAISRDARDGTITRDDAVDVLVEIMGAALGLAPIAADRAV